MTLSRLTVARFIVLSFPFASVAPCASDALLKVSQLEQSGDSAGARTALLNAVQQSPNDPAVLGSYAEFLDRYHSRDARDAYRKWMSVVATDSDQAHYIQRRLVVLDIVDGDRTAAQADLALYRAGGGNDLNIPTGEATQAVPVSYIDIPGPRRSFARMAAIPGDAAPEDVLPALARNVVTNGYQASRSTETLEQTEFIKLVIRYVSQAREIEKFTGPDKILKIETCDSAQTGDLLRVLGFRMRGGCGSDVVLETVNASRAFLTTDSGFPMAELEQALRTNRPFTYDYRPAHIPVLYGPDYWVSAKDRGTGDFLDAFLADPAVCRFYLGMAKLDRSTADELKAAAPMTRLRSYAQVIDFYGGMFEIRNGRAVVPGGQHSAAAWGELVGASPEKGGQFFVKLLEKDDGWLVSLYDAIARLHGPIQSYLADPAHIKRFYAAVRGSLTSPGPARPVFRANADMMLLTSRMWLEPDGRPHVPGGVGVWKQLFISHPRGKYDSKLTRAAANWSGPDDVVEALFALSRKFVENEPLKIFLALSDLDRLRQKPLQSDTVDRLARSYRNYGVQYRIFSDSPVLTDASIENFLDAVETVDHIRDSELRADTAGSLQALIGMWQIFCRQDSLPAARSDEAFTAIVNPFSGIRNQRELFTASRKGVKVLLDATNSPADEPAQDRFLQLLAGGSGGDPDVREQVVKEMQRVLDAQRIVSLTSLLLFAENLEKAAQGQPADTASMQKIASRISEIQLPRAPLSSQEKNAMAFGYWADRHVELQRRLNLRAAIDRAAHDPEHLKDVEGLLAPLLRDTLVAYNYAHYTPPGAQILFTNPLFVREHDFIGIVSSGNAWRNTEPLGSGWPSNGGGRLVGSLANLPYALAEAEENFLVPNQTQALIWSDLVPQMILSAKIPRWWSVTPAQMHWVNLHMRLSESMLAQATLSPDLRVGVLEALSPQVPPDRMFRIGRFIAAGDARAAIDELTPVEMYVMGCTLDSSPALKGDPLAAEVHELAAKHPAEVSEAAISLAFGTPKPTLANSYRPEILKLRTFPTLMGYSSRIMAESWESNTLYWVSIADQLHVPPSQLNILIPEWTQRVVEHIFASHLEDWPALLRSLRTVGEDVRSGSAPQPAGD